MLEIARPTAKEGAWSAEGGGAGVHFHASTSQPDSNPMPTPIRANSLLAYLSGYTSSVVTALRRGFTQGFRLQYRGYRFFRDANNLKSAEDRPDVLTQKIAKEVAAGRIAGPFALPPFPNLQVSPLGLVPKKEPDSFRVIHHLSFPNGNSINDGIAAHDTYVHYQNIDDAIRCIKRFGVAALMSKSDIESAFRILPVHPSDYELLGMKLDGQYYYDKALPMGCSISCKLFEEFSTAIQWILTTKFHVAGVVHVLDDFLFVGRAGTDQCSLGLEAFERLCADVNIPINQSKTVLPCTTITFLGIELDSVSMEARLPTDKVLKIRELLAQYMHRRKVMLVELQSLLGLLNFACKVIRPGRAFLRRLINLTCGLQSPHHRIRLNQEAKADLLAWKTFIDSFNGIYMFPSDVWENSEHLHFYTDASNIGFGAVFGQHWLMEEWPQHLMAFHITVKELVPIVLAVETWGDVLENRCVRFHCDNLAVVNIINKQSSKERTIMSLIRRLVLKTLQSNITFLAEHIPGKSNVLADHLSRLQVDKFRQLATHMDSLPVPIPPHRLII